MWSGLLGGGSSAIGGFLVALVAVKEVVEVKVIMIGFVNFRFSILIRILC